MSSKNRVEAFSDGVMAIAITLLVIELRPPELEASESLAQALLDLWPSYAAYLVSFTVIGVMWLNHHRIFGQVQVVDGPLLLLNLNLLLWMALVPFPTSVVAEHLGDGGRAAETALALYGGLILVTALSYTALYAWVTRGDALGGGLQRAVVRRARMRFGIGIGAYAFAFALSWVSAPLALAFHGAMALYYAFDQASVPAVDARSET